MQSKIKTVFFSPTGTTKRAVMAIAQGIKRTTSLEIVVIDFTLPEARLTPLVFEDKDIIVFGVPVIAGRVPNVLLKYLSEIKGNGALAVPVVSFGNRAYDDALIELRDILEERGLKTIAAAASVGEHSFSKTLAKGRPNLNDINTLEGFGAVIGKDLEEGSKLISPIGVNGTEFPYSKYYVPKDKEGKNTSILKVKPETLNICVSCGICAEVCPMGSIQNDRFDIVEGICIKCSACVKRCPLGAKVFVDKNFIYHKEELEKMYTRQANIDLFFPKK